MAATLAANELRSRRRKFFFARRNPQIGSVFDFPAVLAEDELQVSLCPLTRQDARL
jgi:hypothetical protein